LQLRIAALGLALGIASLATPRVVRAPAELLDCFVGPGILYFRSFDRIRHLPVRIGVSLIVVLGSWSGVSTAVLALGYGLSDGSSVAILVAVYLLAAGAFLPFQSHDA